MNKKTVGIIVAIILIVVLVIVGLFVLRPENHSQGLDKNIQNVDNREGNTSLDSDRELVLYFSETGNTQKLANLISNEVGGDFRRIEPVTPYPTGDALFDYTEEEANNLSNGQF